MSNVNDNQLTYSSQAVSIRHEFFDVEFVVYVEGVDDIPFWDGIINEKMPNEQYKIEQVGGKENLYYYIDGIINNSMHNIVVACDSDYTKYTEERWINNPYIFVTYGHSIENTMFCPQSVSLYLKRIAKSTDNYIKDVETWYNDFCKVAEKLLPYDILNGLSPEMQTVCFNSGCYKFLNDQKPKNLDDKKIDEFIKNIKDKFSAEKLSDIEIRIALDKREVRQIMQGHFLRDAVYQFIREKLELILGKCPSISKDSVCESLTPCKHSTCKHSCLDKTYVYDQLDYFLANKNAATT